MAAEWHEFIRLWAACRGESGVAHWPDAGALGDQAAWVVDGFSAVSAIDAELRDAARNAGGG